MKNVLCNTIGMCGAAVTTLLGGWDSATITLIIFMSIDYASGLILAGVFKKSSKTESGALESKSCWIGLARKIMTLFFVLIGTRLDVVIGTAYIRDAICIAFIINELISITENAGIMGIPIPEVITNAIDLLKNKDAKKGE